MLLRFFGVMVILLAINAWIPNEALSQMGDPGGDQASSPSEKDPCEAAIEEFIQNQNAFTDLSEACRAEAGLSPTATLDNCPSVDKEAFVSLLGQLERGHDQICQACEGRWPEEDLGPGACIQR